MDNDPFKVERVYTDETLNDRIPAVDLNNHTVPEGKYHVEVFEVKKQLSKKKSEPMLVVSYKGIEGASKRKTFKNFYIYNEIGYMRMTKDFTALGVPMENGSFIINNESLVGKKAKAFIGDHSFPNDNQEMIRVSQIKYMEPADQNFEDDVPF